MTRKSAPAPVQSGKAEHTTAPAKLSDPDFMLSLSRGLSVIRAFGEGRDSLSVGEVARITGLSRAAARRCLHTLSVLGYAAPIDGEYELTPAILTLGSTYLGSNPLARAAQPVLERISEQLHESSSLAVLDGFEIVYVARAATRRILSIGLSVGSRLPAASTSMGRVLIAHASDETRTRFLSKVKLPRHTQFTIVDKTRLKTELAGIREAGYSIVDQELELGLRSLAVPVRRADGAVVAAINVGVHAGRANRQTLEREVLPVLREGADDIARAAGHAHPR